MLWTKTPEPVGTPTIPVLGSPSIDVLPPYEGVALADVDSVECMRSISGSQARCLNKTDEDGSGMGVSSSSVTSAVVPFSATVLRVDASCVLYPFSTVCGAYSAHDNCPCI